MTYPMMQHIPLRTAYLCQDCDCVGNCAEQCPACASTVLLNLSTVLDRENDGESAYGFGKPVMAAGTQGTLPKFTSMVA